METITELKKDKQQLETDIRELLGQFYQKYPEFTLKVGIETKRYPDEVPTVVMTDVYVEATI